MHFLQIILCVLHNPFKPRLKLREKKESGRKITYFFTKSIRLRVKNTCTLRKLNRCRFRTSPLLIKRGGGGGGGVFYAGEGNFNIKGYIKKLFFKTYTSTGWVALDIFNNAIYYMKDNSIVIVFVITFFCIAFMFTFKMSNAGGSLRY